MVEDGRAYGVVDTFDSRLVGGAKRREDADTLCRLLNEVASEAAATARKETT